jgi:hypothetical protein
MFTVPKAANLNWFVQGGKLYLAFPSSKVSQNKQIVELSWAWEKTCSFTTVVDLPTMLLFMVYGFLTIINEECVMLLD